MSKSVNDPSNPTELNEKIVLTYRPVSHDIDQDINLFVLWKSIKNRRLGIFISTFILSIVASLGIYSIDPVYKSSMIIRSKLNVSISSLDQEIQSLGTNITEKILNDFLYAFHSEKLRRNYYFEVADLSEGTRLKTESGFQVFSKGLKIEKEKTFSSEAYVVSFLWKNQDESFRILNDFIGFIKKKNSTDIISEISLLLEYEINKLKFQEELEIAQRAEEKLRKISDLTAALRIAKSMNIKKMISSSNNSNDTPLYMRGSEFLEADLNQLKSKKSEVLNHVRDLKIERLIVFSEKAKNFDFSVITEGNFSPHSTKKVSHQEIWVLSSILLIFIFSILVTLVLDTFQRALNKEKESALKKI